MQALTKLPAQLFLGKKRMSLKFQTDFTQNANESNRGVK